jgi:hypothetical protein
MLARRSLWAHVVNAFHVRASSLLFFVVLGAACGGKALRAGSLGDDSDAGTDSGGGESGTCQPLPGCSSTTFCPAPNGCNNTCTCVDGSWACGDLGCGDDVADSGICPGTAPEGECSTNGLTCSYGDNGGGCGITCSCENNQWLCEAPPCTSPVCPANAPPAGSTCDSEGEQCSWGDFEQCGTETCECEGGTWSCDGISCPPMSCPPAMPQNESACDSVGAVCNYPTADSCGLVECNCWPSGIWGCADDCEDAGSGTADAN